jgi:hypothetical protein
VLSLRGGYRKSRCLTPVVKNRNGSARTQPVADRRAVQPGHVGRGDPGRTIRVETGRRPPEAGPVILAPVRRRAEPTLREALRSGWRELALYVAAGVVYVAIGVAFVEFLFSWVVAAGYLLVAVVALPALVARVRR